MVVSVRSTTVTSGFTLRAKLPPVNGAPFSTMETTGGVLSIVKSIGASVVMLPRSSRTEIASEYFASPAISVSGV